MDDCEQQCFTATVLSVMLRKMAWPLLEPLSRDVSGETAPCKDASVSVQVKYTEPVKPAPSFYFHCASFKTG